MGIIRQGFGISTQPEYIFLAVKSCRRFPIANVLGFVRSFQKIFCLGLLLVHSAALAHAQIFDLTRCPDRTKTGVFRCDISKPIVNQPEWVRQDVQFAPGDIVYVGGEGCVQTGGSGPTWKRYVNPSGDNSDRFYHGQVMIPSARLPGTDVGNSLTRIRDVVGRALTVTGEGVPLSALVLHGGYEDESNDAYGDNGYDNHDDGTEDQCKTDISPLYGGPAQLDILICRGVACEPVGSRYDFDTLSSWRDPNGFLWNPHWSWQEKQGNHGQLPSTSQCHQFSKQDDLRDYKSPNFPDCTDQSGIDRVDSRDISWESIAGLLVGSGIVAGPAGTAGAAALGIEGQNYCQAGKVLGIENNDSFAGHVNWFPVTVEGHAHWDGKGTDNDEDFTVHTCNESDYSLYVNGVHSIHAEFDSDETVQYFRSQEWQNVENTQHLDGYTIMTGMFGLDGEHELKSEVHPVYAMATRRDNMENTPSDEVWLMFVRNLGDEGFCSSHVWSGGFTDYTFRLPWRPGMTSVTVDWSKSQFDFSEGTTPTPTVKVVPPGSGIAAPLVPGVQQNVCNTPPPPAASSVVAGGQGSSSTTTAVAGQNKPGAAPATTGVKKSVLKGPPVLGVNPVGSGGAIDPSRTVNVDAGVYVTFHLGGESVTPGFSGPQATTPFIDGALHLVWTALPSIAGPIGEPILKSPAAIQAKTATVTGKTAPPVIGKTAAPVTGKTTPPVISRTVSPVIGSSAPEDADDLETKIAAAINRLTPQQRTTVLKARELPSAALGIHQASPGNAIPVVKSPPATGVTAGASGAHQPVVGSHGPAIQKLVRDAAQIHALCAATNNAPFGLPPEICKPNVSNNPAPSGTAAKDR